LFCCIKINAKPKFFSPRTNWTNGVPQYRFDYRVPATGIIEVKTKLKEEILEVINGGSISYLAGFLYHRYELSKEDQDEFLSIIKEFIIEGIDYWLLFTLENDNSLISSICLHKSVNAEFYSMPSMSKK
jgi:hypothetical protein